MIVSPYNPSNSSPVSQNTCLLVLEETESAGSQSVYLTPLHLQVQTIQATQFCRVEITRAKCKSIEIWITSKLLNTFKLFVAQYLEISFLFCEALCVYLRASIQVWVSNLHRASRLDASDEKSRMGGVQVQAVIRVGTFLSFASVTCWIGDFNCPT